MMRMLDGGVDGFFVMGQNPAVASQNGGLQRRALAKLKWLVVRDLAEIETATFWRDSPEVASGELKPEDIQTEVFLMPAASHVEKEGTFTNTQRLVQYRDKALEPPGDARSELWFIHHLYKRVAAHYADSDRAARLGIRNLHWDYPEHGDEREPDVEAVLKEINGYDVATGRPLDGFTELRSDGSTASRLLDLLRHLQGRRQPGAAPRPRRHARRGRARVTGVGVGVAGQPPHPLQPRLRRPGGQAVVGAQEATSGGTRTTEKWTGYDVPDFPVDKRPDYRAQRRRPRAWTRSAATTRS